MYQEYYGYTKDQLKEGKIPSKLYNSSAEVFEEMANVMINKIVENNKNDKNTVFIVPVGPVGQYPFFVKTVLEKNISLKKCWFINMDEYLDDNNQYIAKDDRLSFRGFMDRELYSLLPEEINIPTGQRLFPDPNNPDNLQNVIESLGGVDIAFGGIGINGHVAFNEPSSLSIDEFLSLNTRALKISEETRVANSIGDLHGNIEDMPKMAVTIGMRQIFNAKKIYLGVFRDWHRAVVRRTLFSAPDSSFPVSLLQKHKDITILINDIAAL